MDTPRQGLPGFLLICFLGGLYFLPTIIAAERKHRNINSIGLTNCFWLDVCGVGRRPDLGGIG